MSSKQNLTGNSAFCILRDTDVYAFTLVGEYATRPASRSHIFLAQAARSQRLVFRYLLKHANRPGKIYAFHALRSLNIDKNQELFSGLLKYEGTVPCDTNAVCSTPNLFWFPKVLSCVPQWRIATHNNGMHAKPRLARGFEVDDRSSRLGDPRRYRATEQEIVI